LLHLIIDNVEKLMPMYKALYQQNPDEANSLIWLQARRVKDHKVVGLYHAACAALVLDMGEALLGIIH
jgi:hypothetical protein